MIPKTVSMGIGIGIGSIQIAVTEGLAETKWQTYGNIALGGLALLASQWPNLIKDETMKNLITAYGWTAAIGGLVKGVFPIALRAMQGKAAPVAGLGISPLTGGLAATAYPGYINSYTARAKGFGTARTAIPTTVPYNIILF